jgi:hypothetical protein
MLNDTESDLIQRVVNLLAASLSETASLFSSLFFSVLDFVLSATSTQTFSCAGDPWLNFEAIVTRDNGISHRHRVILVTLT